MLLWQLNLPPPGAIRVYSVKAEAAVGGTTYNQSILGSINPQSNLFKFTNKIVTASATISGAVRKGITKSAITGVITASGFLGLGGILSFAATGSITMSGSLSDAVTYIRNYSSQINLSGGFAKSILKPLSGVLTLVGNSFKGMFKLFTSSLTLSGIASGFKFTPSAGGVITRGIRFMRKFLGRR